MERGQLLLGGRNRAAVELIGRPPRSRRRRESRQAMRRPSGRSPRARRRLRRPRPARSARRGRRAAPPRTCARRGPRCAARRRRPRGRSRRAPWKAGRARICSATTTSPTETPSASASSRSAAAARRRSITCASRPRRRICSPVRDCPVISLSRDRSCSSARAYSSIVISASPTVATVRAAPPKLPIPKPPSASTRRPRMNQTTRLAGLPLAFALLAIAPTLPLRRVVIGVARGGSKAPPTPPRR